MSRTSFVRRPLAVLASGVVFLGVIVTTPGVAAAAGPPCDGVFHRVPVPKFPGLSELLAVDGVGADDVRVTGLDFSRRTSIVPILHWTGSGWVDETFQAPEFLSYLQGISMDSPNDGVAVGTTLPTGLVERWNGTDWGREARTSELQEVPLFAVEAVNDVDAWAVGAEYGPAGSGVAAGEAQRFVPRPGKTLRATGGADAAGRFEIPNRSEIWHYDGFRWHQADHPAKLVRNTALYGVGASGPDDVWAVGVSHMEFTTRDFYRARRPLLEHWDGSSWTVAPAPLPGSTQNALFSVAVVSPADAWAVGWYANGDVPHIPWVLHYDGTAWTQQDVPLPGGNARLWSVSANGPDDVWAVGDREVGRLQTYPFLEHFDGHGWTKIDIPSDGGPGYWAVYAAPGAEWLAGSTIHDRRIHAIVARRCVA